MVSEFKTERVKDTKRTFVYRTKIWKLHQVSVKSDFNYYANKSKESNEADWSLEDYCKVLEGALLVVTKKTTTCGWARVPASHREAWWWDTVSCSVKDKGKLWRSCLSGQM